MDNFIVDNHPRTIIHIDIDCFYAQVEEVRNPELRTKPLGIQQKNIIVTSNYVARSYGVNKLMRLTDAKRLCPELVLVNGEDLTNYRQMSTKIFTLLQTFTPQVEKLGFDENYLDVTDIINDKLQQNYCSRRRPLSTLEADAFDVIDDANEVNGNKLILAKPKGYVCPGNETFYTNYKCYCGCAKRLILATELSQQIRDRIYTEFGITCSAGIAHNKLLAKIVGSQNKPNKQTVLIPRCAPMVLANLKTLRTITGIGAKTEDLLNEIQVHTIKELQDIDIGLLEKKLGTEAAYRLKYMSYGIDVCPVHPSGKPKSISLEDSCKSISLRTEVEEKFRALLIRLIKHVIEDGRIPIAIKIILRKYDSIKKTSHRETKQAYVSPALFKYNGKITICENGTEDKLLKMIMRLFERSVDLKRPFNITLIGLAFSKFQEQRCPSATIHGSRSIANYLIKKSSDIEVQAVTNLCNDCCDEPSSPPPPPPPPPLSSSTNTTVTNNNCNLQINLNSNNTLMDFDTISEASYASCSSDFSESEIEPSPKKTRINLFITKKHLTLNDHCDSSSPCKLRVANLRLNSKEFDDNCNLSINTKQPGGTYKNQKNSIIPVPPSLHSLTLKTTTQSSSPPSTTAANITLSPQIYSTILTTATIKTGHTSTPPSSSSSLFLSKTSQCSLFDDGQSTTPTVDPTIFNELPLDVRNELLTQWSTTAATATATAISQHQQLQQPQQHQHHLQSQSKSIHRSHENQTLHRYFMKNSSN